MKIAKRGLIEPFRVMAALRDANEVVRAGGDVVHLSLGQPSREVPADVLNTLSQMMKHAPLGYTESTGLVELRTRIAQHYSKTYGVEVPIHRVFVTLGSSAAFLMTLVAAFDAGDTVAITMPCYPAYPNMMKALDVQVARLEGTAANNYQPSLADLKSLKQKPDGLVIGSPSNPTGTILDAGEMKAIAAYCEAEKIRIISDEIYHGVTYGKQAQTILAYTEQAIVLNSFSKYFLMPGWRLGWAVLPEALVPSFEALAQNFFLSPAAISQYAAIEVMGCEAELKEVVNEYRRNRDALLAALASCGFTDIAPAEGAFYLYADVSAHSNDSEQFCRDMLHQAGVVAVSGRDFDAENGNRYVRFSFAGSPDDIAEAGRRLKQWLLPVAAQSASNK